MVIIRPPVWMSIWLTLIGGAHTKDETACYGTSGDKCYSFSLTCDENKIIRITTAEYGYKPPASTSRECCDLNENDCFANYSHIHTEDLYKNCSGKTMCSNNRAMTPSYFECQTFTGRRYAHVKYDCIMANTSIDMCNASVSSASEVNIMFNANKLPLGDSTKCYCQVTARTLVKYQLVDIRLFANLNSRYNCINGFFSINDTKIQCSSGPDDGKFIYVNSPLFEGEIPANRNLTLMLNYQGNVHPDMVWVNLKASTDLAIYCQNFLPTIETTTTTAIEIANKTTMPNGTYTVVQLTSTTNGLSSSGNKSSSSGGYEDGNNLPTIIGVVIAAFCVIAVVVVALILFRRKIQDKALKTSSTEQISPTRCTVANNVLESINPNRENYASLDKCELGNAEYDQLTHDYINTIDAGVEGEHIVPNYANIPAASAPDIHNVAEGTNRTKAAML